ncbi:MAG: MlaE family lipid ABC transporter permease subunit [Salaquimonas sp.]|nr:MlaE family lipid ABC transporter permease subunit [Salaquimonas sp.]
MNDSAPPAPLAYDKKDGLLRIRASGAWTASRAGEIEQELQRLLPAPPGTNEIAIDMTGVTGFDTFGAWLLERFRRDVASDGGKLRVEGMAPANRALFEEMAQVNLGAGAPMRGQFPPWPLVTFLRALYREVTTFLAMAGALVAAAGRMVLHPRRFRLTSTVHQFDRVAWQAVPIILMITFLIGVIIAQQGFFQFRRFGADLYVVNMIGFLIMRELGVLLVAIMVAGRTGSSYTAELGSMKMREEIDALRTMGFDPVEVLILPRILVLVVSLPALAFIGSMAALVGAGVIAVTYAGLSTQLYVTQLREAISFDYLWVGLIKAPFIGAVIGIIACNEGLQVRGSAASLGEHTTRSVVKSIFMIIMLDGLFALFFSAIRM